MDCETSAIGVACGIGVSNGCQMAQADCPRCGDRNQTPPNDAFDVLGMAKRIQQLEAALEAIYTVTYRELRNREPFRQARKEIQVICTTALHGPTDG